MAYEITLLSVYVSHIIVGRQWLGNHVPAATNMHATIEELLDMSFSLRSMSHQRKIDD
jgi:hypothetical protein